MSEETKMPFCSCGSPAIVWLGVARDRVTPLCAEHAGEMKAYIERKWRGAFTGASVSPSPSQDNERRDCVAPSSHAEPGVGTPADEPSTRHRGVSVSPSWGGFPVETDERIPPGHAVPVSPSSPPERGDAWERIGSLGRPSSLDHPPSSPAPSAEERERATHICLDCGALGRGGYHDHGDGRAGDSAPIADMLAQALKAGEIADERDELRAEIGRMVETERVLRARNAELEAQRDEARARVSELEKAIKRHRAALENAGLLTGEFSEEDLARMGAKAAADLALWALLPDTEGESE